MNHTVAGVDIMKNEVDGRLWIGRDERNFLGKGRIRLLELIEETGSISRAAKDMKMSYKAAWDMVDAMNNLSPTPLVERVTGGKGGGGTRLTPYGREIIDTFHILEEEHDRFLHSLSLRINGKNGHLKMLKGMSMRISARNQLPGEVISIERGSVNSHIVISVRGDEKITASITNDSLDELGISEGSAVYALFKANAPMLVDDSGIKTGAENCFTGNIERIERGSVNDDIVLLTDSGNRIAVQTGSGTSEEMGLKEGMRIGAVCKACHIMVGVY